MGISFFLEHPFSKSYLLPPRLYENTHNAASHHRTTATVLLLSLHLLLNVFLIQSIWSSDFPYHFLKASWSPLFTERLVCGRRIWTGWINVLRQLGEIQQGEVPGPAPGSQQFHATLQAWDRMTGKLHGGKGPGDAPWQSVMYEPVCVSRWQRRPMASWFGSEIVWPRD